MNQAMTQEEEMTGTAGGRPGWELSPKVRTAALVLLGVVIVGGLVLAFRPQPVGVDIALVDRGEIRVTVEEDGRTRFRDRYLLAAPVAGELARLTLRAGDSVEAGAILARIGEPASQILDARTREQIGLRIASAEIGVERAASMAEMARAALLDAREEHRRQQVLAEVGGGNASALERTEALLRAGEAEANAAELGIQAAQAEVEDLRLTLSRPAGGAGEGVGLRAPVTGVVLNVLRESAGVVAPGEPILEIGDPAVVEIVVDLLSADAARVSEGAEGWVTGWGGDDPLPVRVRRVEPAGFTRISALGIEEQRVNVFLTLGTEVGEEMALGDGYRVEVQILLNQVEDVLRVPTSALFRRGDVWAVFRVDGEIVRETSIEVGERSQTHAEIRTGLSEGDRVIVYPSDRVADGVRVRERE
jgi:HlyD family secretion protein